MKIGFIGAGNAGVSLGRFFTEKGLKVSGYYSKSLGSAKIAGRATFSKAYDNLEKLVEESDAIVVSVPDDSISNISKMISRTGKVTENMLLIHLSGAIDSGVFSQFEKIGCGCYSLHPVMSFPDKNASSLAIEKAWFTYEGNEKNLDTLEDIIGSACIKARKIKKSDKILYHAGACILSNYLVTLLYFGLEPLKAIGWDESIAKDVFMPLVDASLANFKEKGSHALSGPIARGDSSTLKKHIKALGSVDQNLLELYKVLGLMTVSMKHENSIDKKSNEDILKIFRGDYI